MNGRRAPLKPMTQFEGQQQPAQSAFNQRADTAALRLKGQLGDEISARTGEQVVLPPTPVPVNEDGNPVGPLPPEGTYARMEIDQQQQQQAMEYQRQAAQQAYDPQTPTQVDPNQNPPQQQQEPISQRAQERITSLVSQLRIKDQEFQQLQQSQSQQATTVEELQAKLTAQEQMMTQVMQQNMENLDPETRAQVMADARVGQAVAASEQRILQALRPQLQTLQEGREQMDKDRLSNSYRGYDPMVHDVLIDEFRRANPNCSIEQAFRACATPEELSVGGHRPANVPPPAMPPSSGSTAPRYVPQPTNQVDPVQQIRDDAARAAELARSANPEDQKAATALWHKNLADRLSR